MTKTLTAAVLTVLALLLSACGASSGTSAADKHDAKASRSIATQLKAGQGGSSDLTSQFSFTKKSADCVGTKLVDKIGTRKLQSYGIIDKSYRAKKSVSGFKLKSADAQKATDAFFGCIDVAGKVKALVAKSAASLPASAKACINKVLTAANLKLVFVKFFEGDATGAQSELQGPLSKCATGSQG